MKLDIKKQTHKLYTIITQAYHSKCSSWKLSSKARIAWGTFSTCIQQGEKRKRYHPKSDFQLWQAAHISTKNSINKPAMNNRRLLIAAVFHFMHPVEKDSKKHHKLTKNSVSFNCRSKQVSRCCINFLHELTCQILTNQSIKIGRSWSVINAWLWWAKWKASVLYACWLLFPAVHLLFALCLKPVVYTLKSLCFCLLT